MCSNEPSETRRSSPRTVSIVFLCNSETKLGRGAHLLLEVVVFVDCHACRDNSAFEFGIERREIVEGETLHIALPMRLDFRCG